MGVALGHAGQHLALERQGELRVERAGGHAVGGQGGTPRREAQVRHRVGVVVEDVGKGRHGAEPLRNLLGDGAEGVDAVAEDGDHKGLG